MGQAWCKSKAVQDSKSPFDRALVRCAHWIYPSLKEECSVLGGATQRVTSSEIGFARGCSLDSTDKPFHPSEWVDVNLEVSNTVLYPSICTNLTKNVTPIPPPRKRKKIRGRPLPPKPDDVIENHRPIKSLSTNEEPLYSSVKTSKFKSTYLNSEDSKVDLEGKNSKSFEDSKMLRELCHHEVNGTKEIIPIPSDVVSKERSFIDNRNVPRRSKLEQHDEYERFSSSQSIHNFSAINYFNKDPEDVEHNLDSYKRSKNSSTISLPNYNQLQVTGDSNDENSENNKLKVSSDKLLRKSITGSLPLETFCSNCPKINNERFEDIVWQADFQEIDLNKFENDQEKSMNIHRIESKTGDLNDANNQETEEKCISKTNISSDSGSLNSLETLKDALISQDIIRASTPIKTMDNASRTLEKSEISSSLDSTASSHGEKNKKVKNDSTNCFFSDTSNLYSQVFYEDEETFPDENLKQTSLDNESEPFDMCEEKELALDLQHSRIHRTISQESLPIEMLEAVDSDLDKADEDQEDDSFGKKTAQNVENRVKNSVGIEENKEIPNTPPLSPEPKIKADDFEDDHSTLLKVLQGEAAVVSSSPPSLLELEIALSDMLEKENEQEDNDDLLDQTSSLETKTLGNSTEPCIVSVENEGIFSDKISNTVVPEDVSKCQIKQNIELNNSSSEGKSVKDKVKIVGVELKNNTDNNRSLEMKKQVLHDLSKNNVKDYNILSLAFDSKDFGDEKDAPEKPSRTHRSNLTDSVNNDSIVPTPPRRRHRSGSSILKENICRTTKNKNKQNEDPYVNDRLI